MFSIARPEFRCSSDPSAAERVECAQMTSPPLGRWRISRRAFYIADLAVLSADYLNNSSVLSSTTTAVSPCLRGCYEVQSNGQIVWLARCYIVHTILSFSCAFPPFRTFPGHPDGERIMRRGGLKSCAASWLCMAGVLCIGWGLEQMEDNSEEALVPLAGDTKHSG